MDRNIFSSTDFYIESLEIISLRSGKLLDIIEIVTSVDIYESLFVNSISGSIGIVDSLGVLEMLPIIGEELILLKINKGDSVFCEFKFRVTKISNIQNKNDSSRVYTINVCSEEFIINLESKVSRSFKDKKISFIIEKIFENYLPTKKKVTVEETKSIRSVVIPNISPYKAINWLCSQALSMYSPYPTYIFYEDRYGLYVRSLDLFLKEPAKFKYYLRHTRVKVDLSLDLYTIISYIGDKNIDVISQIDNGFKNSRLITFDPITKTIETNDFSFIEERPKANNLMKNPFYSVESEFESQVFVYPTDSKRSNNPYTTSKISTQQNYTDIEKIKQKRHSKLFEVMNGPRFLLKIPGNPFLNIGDIIEIIIPSYIEKDNVTENELYSGNYLVTKIHHVMQSDKYFMEIEVVRDGVNIEL